ncbi:TPA: hypothetical protein N0F65_009584 [Lagenidium giganteum]|uniref:Transposase n=1 Tax=Lagenidium giganteum TaxID=4803 RepID=A0AAV2YF98_9STRA|nr:TPA: hypothetical protein N0F65_009584 [Lagenidium giganteum]
MCYFHVIANAKKNTSMKGVPQSALHQIVESIVEIHYTFSSEEFAATRDSVLAQWMSKPALRSFAVYIQKQWSSVTRNGSAIILSTGPLHLQLQTIRLRSVTKN